MYSQKDYHKKYYLLHREETLAQQREYYKIHREELLPRNRASKRKRELRLKEEVLMHYGNGKLSCVLCGFTDIAALSIDHINNEGAEHRRQLGKDKHGGVFYRWLKREGYPAGYQTLCMNCQWVKRAKNEWRKYGT